MFYIHSFNKMIKIEELIHNLIEYKGSNTAITTKRLQESFTDHYDNIVFVAGELLNLFELHGDEYPVATGYVFRLWAKDIIPSHEPQDDYTQGLAVALTVPLEDQDAFMLAIKHYSIYIKHAINYVYTMVDGLPEHTDRVYLAFMVDEARLFLDTDLDGETTPFGSSGKSSLDLVPTNYS